ncbi:MAG TPA: acylphosphatase [Candidatus Paceibacterota bacterium]|nr:acylphosphatase [Candidatus Paceibacterota bacterium]
MHERLSAIVSGRVQMVMYRDFAQRMAWLNKLSGEVQNLPDGTVRVVAEGDRVRLERFLKKLHQGPLLASVKSVSYEWQDATGEFTKFSIVYA